MIINKLKYRKKLIDSRNFIIRTGEYIYTLKITSYFKKPITNNLKFKRHIKI